MRSISFRHLVKYMTLTFIGVILFVSLFFYNDYEKQERHDLKNELMTIVKEMDDQKLPLSHHRISVLNVEGDVLSDNRYDVTRMSNQNEFKEIMDTLQYNEGYSVRHSKSSDDKTLFYATWLKEQETIIRIGQSQLSYMSLMVSMLPQLLVIYIILVALAYGVSKMISSDIEKEVNHLKLESQEKQSVIQGLEPIANRIMMFNDHLTLQQHEQRKLQDSFDKTINLVHEGFVLLDSDHRIVSYNKAAQEIFDLESHHSNLSLLVYNRDPILIKGLEQVRNQDNYSANIKIKNRDYKLIMNHLGEHHYEGVIIALIDITDQKQYEDLRKEFSANVSHELKTPLTSILGTTELLRNNMVKEEDVPHFMENIYRETEHMIKLVNDIIKISRLDEQEDSLNGEKVDIVDLTNQIIMHFEQQIKAKNVSIRCNLTSLNAFGIESTYRDIISNVIENAIKYNHEGGYLTIKQKNENTLVVENSGTQIKNIDKIYERFYRESNNDIEGSGLGLSLIKNGMHLNGGHVDLENIEDGVRITLIFNQESV